MKEFLVISFDIQAELSSEKVSYLLAKESFLINFSFRKFEAFS
jgi:hypothetical protein